MVDEADTQKIGDTKKIPVEGAKEPTEGSRLANVSELAQLAKYQKEAKEIELAQIEKTHNKLISDEPTIKNREELGFEGQYSRRIKPVNDQSNIKTVEHPKVRSSGIVTRIKSIFGF